MRKYAIFCVIILHFLATPLVFLARAATANATLELAVLPPVSAPEIAASPTPTNHGGTLPGLIVPPYLQETIFVNGESQVSPYVIVMVVSGQDVAQGKPFFTYSREPDFLGKTNLKNAVLYLEYDHMPGKIFTTFADLQGRWHFASPAYLEVGWHTLFMNALSPLNPYFGAYNAFQFYVAPIPQEGETPQIPPQDDQIIIPPPTQKPAPKPTPIQSIPVPKQTPYVIDDNKEATEEKDITQEKIPGFLELIPPKIPPEPPTPITSAKDTYGIRLEVAPQSKTIHSGEQVQVDMRVIPLPPHGSGDNDTRDITLIFRVYDSDGKIIYEKKEKRNINDAIDINKYLQTTPITKPGKYLVSLEIDEGDVAYISTDTFTVEERETNGLEVIIGGVRYGQEKLLKILFMGFIFLIFFLILFFREYFLSRRSGKIRDIDLKREGYIK